MVGVSGGVRSRSVPVVACRWLQGVFSSVGCRLAGVWLQIGFSKVLAVYIMPTTITKRKWSWLLA